MLHYLPGCDVQKNHPQAVLKMRDYMIKQGAIIDQCCRVKDKFLNQEDTIVNNCTLCNLILKERYQETKCLSLYEYILEDENFPWINHHGKEITVQDCWRTKDNLAMQNAIRQCLKKMNFKIVEMDDNFDQTKYCGVWLNNNPSKECIELAPHTMNDIIENHIELLSEKEQIEKMENWVSNYKTEDVLVYCNGCEKGIKLGGGNPIHIIELLAKGL